MRVAFKEFNETISRIESAYHEASLRLKLSDSEESLLYTLVTYPEGCRQSVLYRESGLTKSTANSALKKMEKDGIVLIQPEKGRNTLVRVTEAGKNLMKDTVYKVIQIENEIYDSWTPEEQALFLRLNQDFAEKMMEKIKRIEDINPVV